MADFALIKNGKVENVIVSEQSFINTWLPSSGYDLAVIRNGRKGNVGQEYINGNFIEKTQDYFTGDSVEFILNNTCSELLNVYVNGVPVTNYTFSQNKIIFSTPPGGEVVIEYKYIVV